MKSWLLAAVSSLLAVTSGCKSDRLQEPDPGGGGKPRPAAVGAGNPAPVGPRLRFEKATAGDVPALVKTARDRATAEQRAFLVYVGATWCEPCQRFHDAAQKGELDAELPPITFLEFDADVDTSRLRPAGYSATYIPLFAAANAEGRASGKFIEGGVKGQNAAREIVPRLKALLGI